MVLNISRDFVHDDLLCIAFGCIAPRFDIDALIASDKLIGVATWTPLTNLRRRHHIYQQQTAIDS
jgi:hypothetical protein